GARAVVVLLIVRLHPVAEQHVAPSTLEPAPADGADHPVGVLPVVDAATAAPLSIREQKAVGDVEIAVRGAVVAARVPAVLVLIPGHDPGSERALVPAVVTQHR